MRHYAHTVAETDLFHHGNTLEGLHFKANGTVHNKQNQIRYFEQILLGTKILRGLYKGHTRVFIISQCDAALRLIDLLLGVVLDQGGQ